MLQITIPKTELWDEKKQEFIIIKKQNLRLEHSLVSISKWESKWHKPFLTKQKKTVEEMLYYIECMTLTQNVNPNVYFCLTDNNFNQIEEYIHDSMSATRLPEDKTEGASPEIYTSELIYYYMIALNIPLDCEKWHLNRLLTLIAVCNLKNKPPKKMSSGEIMRRNKALNEARKKRWNTTG